jgi:dipeptidyl-peptidase-4
MKKAILFAILTTVASSLFAQAKEITLEDIWQYGTFRVNGIHNIRSMNDGEHYTVLSRSGIDCYSYASGEKESTILEFSSLADMPPVEGYEFSADERLILLESEFEPIYRHSGVSTYYVYDREKGSARCITNGGKQRLTTFSPDGTKVAYVRDNNLFWMDLASLEEHAVTSDGSANHIINGTTDWVYEEEFAITKGFAWSPDSKKIAYLRFDESHVREYNMQLWGALYPDDYRYKYPKAGEANSIVSLRIYKLESGKTQYAQLGGKENAVASAASEWEYIPRFQWADKGTLAVMRMNRLQNHMQILTFDTDQDGCEPDNLIYEEQDNAYVDVPDTWQFFSLGNGKNAPTQMLITSERDGYRHIYLYDMDGKLVKQVTSGDWEVCDVPGIDVKNRRLYYTSREDGAINKSLFLIGFDGKGKRRLSAAANGTYNASFSNGCKYYIQIWSDALHAPVYTLHNAKGKLIKTLEDNASLQQKMKDYGALNKSFSSFTTSNGTELNCYMITPQGFDHNHSKRYPVLIYVYGGPGNQQVSNSYGYSDYYWYHMLASKGYVVFCFDGRGTGGRGAEFKKQTYRDLGHMECEDAIEAARWLGKQSWVDKDRIGIWGWSFGGYLSSLAILKGNDVFKTAIAVAPVITWRYYDNIYTERFLALPKDNAKGYDDNSPLNFADRLKGNYLLIHGTGDDNVHVQNSMDMISALEKAGKQFEFRLYPNKNHSIYGGNTRLNLYQLMTDYILRNL